MDRYGIPPELVPDFVGLKGDTSDNIPGVPGIGEKTATQLLQEWGDLEGVLANIDNISGAKRKENLREHAENARISKELATSQREVEGVDVDLAACIAREPDRSRLREVFREFELRAPLERLEEALDEDEAVPVERRGEVMAVQAREVAVAELGALEGELVAVAALRPGESVDEPVPGPDPEEELELAEDEAAAEVLDEDEPLPETAPAGPAQGTLDFGGAIRGPLSVAAYAGDEVLVAEAETLAAFTLARGDRPVVAHDWKTLAMADDPSVAPPLDHDTMVAAYLIDPARRGYPLDELAADAGLGVDVTGANGAAERAVLTRLLAERQRERLEEDGLTRLLHEIELPLVDVLVEMERAGVKLDVQRLRAIGKRFDELAANLERRVWDLAGEEFTIGSPQQLAPILFEKLGLSRKRRGKTGFSTDARVLHAIRHEHEIVPAIEEWREVTKLKSTYLDAFPELVAGDGRLHTTFSQTTAATGRLSSTNPNLQNIPIRTEQGREIRACFVAEPGHSLVLGRLLAGGAAAAGPHRRRAGAEGHLPARRGRAHRHGGGDPGREDRPGHALQGQDGELRDRLRPVRVRPGRPPPDRARGGAGVHRPLPGALPGRGGVHPGHDRQGHHRGARDHALRPHPARSRAALAQPPDAAAGRAAGREHGDPGHGRGHHQGGHGAGRATGCAARAWPPASCSRSTTSCCSRHRTRRWSAPP